MKYKYIVGLLVALSLNNAFAADELYQGVYETLTSERLNASQRINGALDENQTYDNKKDTNLCRSILAGFQLRKAVFSLDATELETIVRERNEFFKTSLGMSLVYGWTLKHFAAPKLPYYIVGNFSFGQHFNLIADKFTTEQTKTFLKSTFTNGLAAVNADQDTLWEFYSDAISALCVVESIGSSDGTLSMDGIIEGSYLTDTEMQASTIHKIDDSRELDGIDHARHLDTELDESIVRTYYDVIKDQFSDQFVSGKNMIKLQYLVDLINVGAIKECAVLRAIPVEENKVFSLNASLIGDSGNILGFDAVQEIKTLRELCNYLLGVYAKEQDAIAAKKEEKAREIIALKSNLVLLKGIFSRGAFKGEKYLQNYDNARQLAIRLKKHNLMSEAAEQRLAASKAIATLKDVPVDDDWAMEQLENVTVLQKSTGFFGVGAVTKKMVDDNNRKMALIIKKNTTKTANNAKKQAKIDAARFLFDFIQGLELTA